MYFPRDHSANKAGYTAQDGLFTFENNMGRTDGGTDLRTDGRMEGTTMTSEASGMSNSFTALDWIVLFVCDFFPLVANKLRFLHIQISKFLTVKIRFIFYLLATPRFS